MLESEGEQYWISHPLTTCWSQKENSIEYLILWPHAGVRRRTVLNISSSDHMLEWKWEQYPLILWSHAGVKRRTVLNTSSSDYMLESKGEQYWISHPLILGVCGNERADRLASTADITSDLQLGRVEVLRSLRNFLNMDRPERRSIDRLKERGVEKESGRHSTLRGRERSVLNQTNIGTVSRTTLGRLLRDGGGARMGLCELYYATLSWNLNRNSNHITGQKRDND